MHTAIQVLLAIAVLLLVVGVVAGLLFPKSSGKGGHPLERVRSLAGLLAVLIGDAAIVAVVVWGVNEFGDKDTAVLIGLLTAAFTAVSTMTTAYLGIKAVSNTAQVLSGHSGQQDGHADDDEDLPGGPPRPGFLQRRHH
ncbi:hypothetical protein ACH4U6_25750 [Streptomyces netropsis]|uniref:hypothetical protein n=1 Tax=Streptomyces netropsis TaxID=55404 RepID=UPI0037B00336